MSSPMMNPFGDPMQDFASFIESIGMFEEWTSNGLQSIDQSLLPLDPMCSTDLQGETMNANHAEGRSLQDSLAEKTPIPNFGSRLPSLQPEIHEERDPGTPLGFNSTRDIREADYQSFLKKLDYFQTILPNDSSVPSRLTLSRLFQGFIDGLNEHLPFIHTPTLQVGSCHPGLLLAVAACGAQYRFESEKGSTLFYGAYAIVREILARKGYGVTSSLLPNSLIPSLSDGARFCSIVSDAPEGDLDELMETIQIILLLVIHVTWGGNAKAAQELIPLQSTLASLVREHGLKEKTGNFELADDLNDANWHLWAKGEVNRRTKFVAYCFLNLHSLMYNIPPLILTSEIELNMPCPNGVWTSQNESTWRLAYEKPASKSSIPFQHSFSLLFKEESSAVERVTSTPFGNHILLHALSQQLYFARPLCLVPIEHDPQRQRQKVTGMETVLRNWKSRWKQTPESSTDPRNPAGPIAFTSAALLGQVYVRLQLDIGPHLNLITRDPSAIAQALISAPGDVTRGPGIITPLLHAVHALSIPIQLGVDFVAKTYSFHWSVQHSLGALEYAHLLAVWLQALPKGRLEALSRHEKMLFLWITRLLDETDMAIKSPMGNRLELTTDPSAMRKLSCSIMRIWARSFSGNICWGLVDVIGLSLNAYADILEKR